MEPQVATKKRKVSLTTLLGTKIKKEVATPTAPELDELEQYLADPEDPDIEVKVLAWWKAKESKWPALAKMVKQYFAAPASSAGVERVFSAAGKMHGDAPEVGQGLDARAFALCRVQHGLSECSGRVDSLVRLCPVCCVAGA